MRVLSHPGITRDRKKELLQQVFGERLGPDIVHFLTLLIDRDRAELLPQVVRQFGRLWDEHRKQMDVEAVTAVPLAPEQEAALRERLEASTGYTLRLKTTVNENVLGGLIIRFGDKLIDGSVATELQGVREHLRRAKVT